MSDHVLTIVVPIYNEAATLRPAVERLLNTELPVDVEVLLVDDGSTDGSLATVADFERSGRLRTIAHGHNQGKGAAVRTGIAAATGDLLAVLDADLEYNPSDYTDLLEPILDGRTRVSYGTRHFSSQTVYSFWYVVGNRVVTVWASFLFNTWLTDVETCFKVAETELWRAAKLHSKGFGIEAEITGKLLKAGHKIFEAPITYRARTREEGKKLSYRDGFVALWVLTRERFRRAP